MPTITDRDFLEMAVADVRRVRSAGQDHHVVVLREAGGGRRLPIWIGRDTAVELAVRLLGQGGQLARPLGSDLTARLVEALGGGVREVRVDRLSEGTFYAVVSVDGPRGAVEVDARPSDALALALVVGVPVLADREMVDAVEGSEEAAEALAAADGEDATGARALLDELAAEAQGEEPAGA